MTIRKFIDEKAYTLDFLDFINYLEENDLELGAVENDLSPVAMEIQVSGFDDEDNEDHFYFACIHICMDDEVCDEDDEDEGLYYEVLDAAERGNWSEVYEHMETYYMLISDDNEDLLNWRDSGISDEEMRRLAYRESVI